MESNFPNPLEFKPERFFQDSDIVDTRIDRLAYFPFSLGPRNCIGQTFAQIEAMILLVKFLQRFDFKLQPPTDSYPKSHVDTSKTALYILSTLD